MTGRIDREELRALVRQALREALGDVAGNPASPSSAPQGLADEVRAQLGRSGNTPARVTVRLSGDADLRRFARDLILAAEQQDLKAAIMAGNVQFSLSTGAPQADRQALCPAGDSQPKGTFHVSAGVLTEAKVAALGGSHDRIVIGADVVLTPLARDRARELKVELVRKKQ